MVLTNLCRGKNWDEGIKNRLADKTRFAGKRERMNWESNIDRYTLPRVEIDS